MYVCFLLFFFCLYIRVGVCFQIQGPFLIHTLSVQVPQGPLNWRGPPMSWRLLPTQQSLVVTKVVNTARVASGASGVAAFKGVKAPELLRCLPLDSRCQQRGIRDGRLGVDVADDTTRVVSGARGMAAAGVRRGGGVAIVCVVRPSTPGDNGEASDNGRLCVVVASNCRVSPVHDFEGAQVMAVSRSVSFPPPPLLGVWGALELRSRYLSSLMFLAPLDEFNL